MAKLKYVPIIILMLVLSYFLGNYLFGVVPTKSLTCEKSTDCPKTVKFFSATLTNPSCTIEGYCAYDTCISGCTDSLCSGYDLKCPQTEGCGDGICKDDENCVNCPEDCGKCCIDGEKKNCVCKGNTIYCYVCQNGKWSSTDYAIKFCRSDEKCENAKCVKEEPEKEKKKECSFHWDCFKEVKLSQPYCKNGRVYQLYKSPLCISGKCFSTRQEKLIDDCIKDGKICKDRVCVAPTKEDREDYDEIFKKCGERICVYRNRIGNCIEYVTINRVCDGDYIIYNCDTGERIDCRERGYEKCSMIGLDGKPSDGHCVGKVGHIPVEEPTEDKERKKAECLSNKDCPSGQICEDGVCVEDLGMIKCNDDSDCMEKLGEVRCWAYCDDGICKVGKINYPEKPCKNAEWDMESCSWDVSLCEDFEKRCPENEILTEDGRCICKEGFTRFMGYCVEKGKITQAGLIGGATLLIGGIVVVVFVMIFVLLIMRR